LILLTGVATMERLRFQATGGGLSPMFLYISGSYILHSTCMHCSWWVFISNRCLEKQDTLQPIYVRAYLPVSPAFGGTKNQWQAQELQEPYLDYMEFFWRC